MVYVYAFCIPPFIHTDDVRAARNYWCRCRCRNDDDDDDGGGDDEFG